MIQTPGNRWPVGDLPFIWRPLPSPRNPEDLPDLLPFTLAVDAHTEALVQEFNPRVSAALERAYVLGSAITGQMDDTGIGRGYADDFIHFMGSDGGLSRFEGKRVLEVGCGNGYLLHRLAEHGASVLGIEPGQHDVGKYDVPIIRDFFPSSRVTGKHDVIIAYALLEHIADCKTFLGHVLELLDSSGEIFLAVPDCGPYIDAGDISCLFHEHWSYFDRDTLARTAGLAGAGRVAVSAGRFGGMLYARIPGTHDRAANPDATRRSHAAPLAAFRERAERGIALVARYLEEARSGAETVGIYVPGRVVNALFAGRMGTAHCRFFDDNPLLSGTYFPGLPIPVEDRAALVARPTDRVLIMSRSFGDQIAKQLSAELPPAIRITTWHELFARDSHVS